jgi:aminopeptidase N
VTIESGGSIETAKVTVDQAKQIATFAVGRSLPVGRAVIHVHYRGILNEQMRGFYIGKDDQGRKYAATQLEDTDARRAFPSFDEPAYKASFDVTVVADKGLAVISNGKVISDMPSPGEKHTVQFATSPKMSSYLVAIVVGNFEYVEGSADGIPIRVYASTGKKELGTFALAAAQHNLRFYDNYFGIKYPYGKLDLVGLADFSAGAMENTGCITFREILLLLDEKHAAISLKKTVASVIAHEMAHQWFGDLVTMEWWDDKWLNEGFASWMSSKPVAAWKPDWNVDIDNANDTVNSIDLDSLVNTHPIHQPADTPEQILELDDAITYGKAAAVLRMLESYLGPETFRAGINTYLKKYSYRNAAAADFWTVQTEISKKPVDRLMPTWVEQAGLPLLTVNAKCSHKSQVVSLEQQRYFYDRIRLEQSSPELWQVPVCIRGGSASADSPTSCELVSKKQATLTLPSCTSWEFVNAGAMGFYHSAYESEAVRSMAKDIERALKPAERIMLLSDVWASVMVDREPIGDYLRLAEGLESDRNDAVLGQLLAQLTYISERLTNDSDSKSYGLWVYQLLKPIADDVGWVPKAGERESLNALRANLLFTLAYVARDPQTQSLARKIADEALTEQSSVNREIALSALQAAASRGDEVFYDRIAADLKNAKTPEIYFRDVSTLARFRDPKLVERTLQFALSRDMRSQDSPYLISAVMQIPGVETQAWTFVRDHWAGIEKLGGAFAGGTIVQATGSFCDRSLREQVKNFFTAHPAPAAERSLKQSIERMSYCIDVKIRQQNRLASWLQHEQESGAAEGNSALDH